MKADPVAFRAKYRKMASDPHAFYRGSACLFYADVTADEDPFADDHSGRIWVHGDLHVENFGTYLNSDGRLVFDVNDFDEAYLGRFTWDLQRFAASLALVGWQKALPEEDVRRLIGATSAPTSPRSTSTARSEDDDDFALHLDNTHGPIRAALVSARCGAAPTCSTASPMLTDGIRMFRDHASTRRLARTERGKVVRAFERYLETIPEDKHFDRDLFYDLRDVVGKSGFGIGSAGLPAYNVLVEGFSQALDNDVVLSMKQANIPAVSRFVDTGEVEEYFEHEGHRTVVSQRALQVHTDPMLGHTTLDGVGYVVSEVSPYEVDLDWSSTHRARRHRRRRRPARPGHRQDPLRLRRGQRAGPRRLPGRGGDRRAAWTAGAGSSSRGWPTSGSRYAERVREDHALFVQRVPRGPDRRSSPPARSAGPVSRRRPPPTTRWRAGGPGAANADAAKAVSIGPDDRVDPLLGTSAMAEPPKPPPVIRAPIAPASTAVDTARSSSGQEISKSSRMDTCDSAKIRPSRGPVAGLRSPRRTARPGRSR